MAESTRTRFVEESKISNTQRCWVVPTKYYLEWTVENMLALGTKKIESPIINGPADTSFQLQLELFQGSVYVKMRSHSSRAPLKVKGEITLESDSKNSPRDCHAIKPGFKIGKDFRTISPGYPAIGSNLFLLCKFIAFPFSAKQQKIARKEDYYDLQETKKFGTSLSDFREDSFLTDTFLLVESKRLPVHRLVLRARCPKMLNCVEKTNPIFKQYGKEVVNSLLDYVYTGNSHELIEKSRSLRVLKAVSKLGLIFEVPAVEHLFEIRKAEITTRCHRCKTVFEWVISASEILKLEANGIIKSTKFNLGSASCCLLLSKESIQYEKKNAEVDQLLCVSLRPNNLIKSLEGTVILMDSKKKQLDIIKSIKAAVKSEPAIHFFPDFNLDQQFAKELFTIICYLEHDTSDNYVQMDIKTFDGIRYSYDKVHLNEFYKDFEYIHKIKDFADLQITVKGGNKFYQYGAHKIVFAARSPTFKRMIADRNDIEINVPTSIYDCFHHIIKYFYTGQIDFYKVFPLDVYRFAYDYEVMDLLWRARKELSGHWLSEQNAASAMVAAIECKDEFLKASIEHIMRTRYKKWWNSEMKMFRDCFEFNERKKEKETQKHGNVDETKSSGETGAENTKTKKTILDYFPQK